jgi:hypothetical protein
VLFDHGLIHYSPPNITKEPRIAASLMLTPKDVNLFHYTADTDDRKIKEFNISSEHDFTKIDSSFYQNEPHKIIKK